MICRYGWLLVVCCTMLLGTGYDFNLYNIPRSKVREGVRLLYPTLQDEKQIDLLANRKEIEWSREFKRALDNDDIEKVKIFFDIGFFKLKDMHVVSAYKAQSLQVMIYFLRLLLQQYETKTLVQKEDMDFFSFLPSMPDEITPSRFHQFLIKFASYFANMRFFSNFQAATCDEQIQEYNDYVALGWINKLPLEYDTTYIPAWFAFIKKQYKKSSSEDKYSMLTCAELFRHEMVLRMLHFPQDFNQMHALGNVHIMFT